MAGVTDNGWETLTNQQIVESLQEDAKEAWGDIPTTPDSVLGELFNIVAAPIKDLWELAKQVEDTQNRDSATGIYLDYLAELVGLSRQQESGATGYILFTGKVGTSIPVNTVCKDTQARNVLTTEAGTINRSNCYQSTFNIKTLADNTDYTLVVEGVSNTYNSGTGATKELVLLGLKTTLDANTETINTIVDETLVITYQSFNNQLTTTNTSNITLYSCGVLLESESAETGDLDFYEDTVTTLVTTNLGIYSVNNPADFISGRLEETDEELRLRMAEREQSTGTATKPAIEASLEEITGVTRAYMVVNDTLEDDTVTGVPAKSFEVFVTGGDETDIAQVLWDTKPAIGKTYGTVEKTIIDRNGDTQAVKFSRLTEKVGWLRITYTINSEEDFPAAGESTMQSLVIDKGNSMYSGEDLTPAKFYGTLYSVQGVYIESIEVAITDTISDTPVYTTVTQSVSKSENLTFSTDTVTITTV